MPASRDDAPGRPYRARRALPPDPSGPGSADDDFEGDLSGPAAAAPASPRRAQAAPASPEPELSGRGRPDRQPSEPAPPRTPAPAEVGPTRLAPLAEVGDATAVTPPHPGRTAAMPDRPYAARRSAGSTAAPTTFRQARHSATTVLPATRARRATVATPPAAPAAPPAPAGRIAQASPRTPVQPATPASPTRHAAPAALPATPASTTPASTTSPTTVTTPASPGSAEPAHGETHPAHGAAPAHRRRRWGILAGAAAAAVAVAAGVVFLVVTILGPGSVASPPPGSASVPPTSGSSASPGVRLTDDMMLTTAAASRAVGTAGWKIASDTTGPQAQPVTATCLHDVTDLQAPQQQRTRTLTAATSAAALHEALLYANPGQAEAAYAARVAALGGCGADSAFLVSGSSATKLGDAAAGVMVAVQDSPAMTHTVWIARTGSAVDIVDLAVSTGEVAYAKAAAALADLVGSQCTAVGGACTDGFTVADAPPPPGATDGRGLLVVADIPSLKGSGLHWAAGTIQDSAAGLRGSQCEGMDLGKVSETASVSKRSYLLADDVNNIGIDMVVYTMKSAAAATKTASTLSDNIDSCKQLTATVSGKATYTAPKGSPAFSGTSYVVTQQLADGKTSYRYRVSVTAVDKQVVYLFTNVTKSTDFSTAQWKALSIRAAQRAAQAS